MKTFKFPWLRGMVWATVLLAYLVTLVFDNGQIHSIASNLVLVGVMLAFLEENRLTKYQKDILEELLRTPIKKEVLVKNPFRDGVDYLAVIYLDRQNGRQYSASQEDELILRRLGRFIEKNILCAPYYKPVEVSGIRGVQMLGSTYTVEETRPI